MKLSTENKDVLKAFGAARRAMGNAKKNATNPHLKNNYANIEAFLNAIRPALETNDLYIVQDQVTGEAGGDMIIETTIIHETTGQWLSGMVQIPIQKRDAQGTGSAMTYARRYAIAAMFGIAQADDDGNATRKSAANWKKEFEAIEDLDTLKQAFGEAYKYLSNDSASQSAVTEAYNVRKAALTVSPATAFNPSKPFPVKDNSVRKEDTTPVINTTVNDF